MKADNVGGVLAVKQGELSAEGPFRIDLRGVFSLLGRKLEVPALAGEFDLTGSRLRYEAIFAKEPGVVFTGKVDGAGGGDGLAIKAFALQLARLRLLLSGAVGLASPWESNLEVAVAPVSLAGIEAFLPPLRGSPVQGEIDLSAVFRGRLSEPARADILLRSLNLKGFSARAEYVRPGAFQIRGPVSLDLRAQGEVAGGELKSAMAQGKLNAKDAALVVGPLRKEPGGELVADFSVRNIGQRLSIEKSSCSAASGVFPWRARFRIPHGRSWISR
ncbi:MAG: hypothetical protein HC902_14270 [Calothrix sp. SM1_5_4]|nr:hypothetical protein [Calothrix sp. SM1_5_4]